MPTYSKCPKAVKDMVQTVIDKHAFHEPLAKNQVIIDLLFEAGDVDDKGTLVGPAIFHQGYVAHGLARIINTKDRAKGNGDAEILLDYDWWTHATEEQQEALIDHELTHLAVKTSRTGVPKTDDLGRPAMTIRKHDIQAGWFLRVANDNGEHSIERMQAKAIKESVGQLLWPEILSEKS